MVKVIAVLKEGGRFREIRDVHRASNGNQLRGVRDRLEKRNRPFLEMNPVRMNREQQKRLTRASDSRTRKGILIDFDERRLVLVDEVEA